MSRPWLWLVPPVAAGVWLRCWLLVGQIAGGDELHSVRAALSMPLRRILITYLPTDHCLPLTAFYRLLLDAGLRMNEMHFRLPVLISGIALLIAAPIATSKLLGRAHALVFAWLLAVSPVLVLYSRIIRSYLPMVLLSAAAAWSFYRFVQTGSRVYAMSYAALGAAAVYFHLVAAPFVLSPLVFLCGHRLLSGRAAGRNWRDVAVPLASIGAGFAVFMIPARESLADLFASKHASAMPSWTSVQAVLKLQAGSAEFPPVALFWCLALRGLWVLRRWSPDLLWYGVCLVCGQIAGLLILRPLGIEQPLIFNRYLIVTLPIVLCWVACGLTGLRGRGVSGRSRRAVWLLPAAVLLFLVLRGPLVSGDFYSGSFMHRNEALGFHDSRAAEVGSVPPIYATLAERGAETIVELPWPTSWRFGRVFPHYQRAHGLAVMVSPFSDLLASNRLAFRNMIAADPEAILASGADFVLMHTDLESEESALARDRGDPPRWRGLERRKRMLAGQRRRALRLLEQCRQRWGSPDFGDRRLGIHGWDLDRIRSVQDR